MRVAPLSLLPIASPGHLLNADAPSAHWKQKSKRLRTVLSLSSASNAQVIRATLTLWQRLLQTPNVSAMPTQAMSHFSSVQWDQCPSRIRPGSLMAQIPYQNKEAQPRSCQGLAHLKITDTTSLAILTSPQPRAIHY